MFYLCRITPPPPDCSELPQFPSTFLLWYCRCGTVSSWRPSCTSPSSCPTTPPSTGHHRPRRHRDGVFCRIDPGSCDSTTLKSSIACDILVEMIFILDIIFNFRMTFVNGKGEVVYKMRDIALNYVKGNVKDSLVARGPPRKVGSCSTSSPLFPSTCSTPPAPSRTWSVPLCPSPCKSGKQITSAPPCPKDLCTSALSQRSPLTA